MRRIGSALVAVAALYMAVQIPGFVGYATSGFSAAKEPGGSELFIWLGFLPLVVAAAMIFALVRWRDWIGAGLFDDDEANLNLAAREVLQIVIVLVGLVVTVLRAADALLAIANVVADWNFYTSVSSQDGVPTAIMNAVIVVALPVIEVGFALLLVRFAEPLARRLWVEPKPVVVEAEPVPVELPRCPSCGAEYDPADYVDMATARCTACHSLIRPGTKLP